MRQDSLDRVRSHAAQLREMIAAAQQESHGIIYRVLATLEGEVVALALICAKHQAPVAQVTASWNTLLGETVSRLTGPTVTPEELAIFLGLGRAPVEHFGWVHQIMEPPRAAFYQPPLPQLDETAED